MQRAAQWALGQFQDVSTDSAWLETFGVLANTRGGGRFASDETLVIGEDRSPYVARWAEIQEVEPEFAEDVRALFDSRKHKVLATLRKDGSPRLSGIEVTFADGDVWIGSMSGSRKSADLSRDPRLGIQITSEDPPQDDPSGWAGDARLSGAAIVVDEPERLRCMANGGDGGSGELQAEGQASGPPDGGLLYRINITEAVLTRVASTNDHMVIESWTAARGYRRVARY